MFHNFKCTLISDKFEYGGDDCFDIRLDTGEVRECIYYKYLEPLETVVSVPVVKPGWQDDSDKSVYKNIRPGIDAACAYAYDGSCWEWAVGAGPQNILSYGRSIDRRTAKSDAEFFINNYQPEDTTERDELRRKLERSWHGS
jgi:hypothetical protein